MVSARALSVVDEEVFGYECLETWKRWCVEAGRVRDMRELGRRGDGLGRVEGVKYCGRLTPGRCVDTMLGHYGVRAWSPAVKLRCFVLPARRLETW